MLGSPIFGNPHLGLMSPLGSWIVALQSFGSLEDVGCKGTVVRDP